MPLRQFWALRPSVWRFQRSTVPGGAVKVSVKVSEGAGVPGSPSAEQFEEKLKRMINDQSLYEGDLLGRHNWLDFRGWAEANGGEQEYQVGNGTGEKKTDTSSLLRKWFVVLIMAIGVLFVSMKRRSKEEPPSYIGPRGSGKHCERDSGADTKSMPVQSKRVTK